MKSAAAEMSRIAVAPYGRWAFARGPRHLRRLGAVAEAPHVEAPHVEAARGDVVHPGHATEGHVELGVREYGAVDEQQGAVRRESGERFRPLVAEEQLDAGVARRDQHVLGHDARRGLRGGGESGGGESG